MDNKEIIAKLWERDLTKEANKSSLCRGYLLALVSTSRLMASLVWQPIGLFGRSNEKTVSRLMGLLARIHGANF